MPLRDRELHSRVRRMSHLTAHDEAIIDREVGLGRTEQRDAKWYWTNDVRSRFATSPWRS